MSEVKILFKKLHPDARVPTKAHSNDAGFDVYTCENVSIHGGVHAVVRTGIAVAIPDGWELQVRSRSGLACGGIVVANSPGTIDSGYRGEVCVILHNRTQFPKEFRLGDRIAQLVVGKVYDAEFVEVDKLDDTQRGTGGFGSSGQ